MTTVGIDLSTQPRKTALCRVTWHSGHARIDRLESGDGDRLEEQVLEFAENAEKKIAIDAPFGWPEDFVRAVSAHHKRDPWPGTEVDRLRLRSTDRFVKEKTREHGTPVNPLSVSADKIGSTAMTCVRLLAKLGEHGWDCARGGSGDVLEVYPAAALAMWGLPRKGYKEAKGRDTRAKILERLKPHVDVGGHHEKLLESDDALDALVAALIAQCWLKGCCFPVPAEDDGRARVEGWIALPRSASPLAACVRAYRSRRSPALSRAWHRVHTVSRFDGRYASRGLAPTGRTWWTCVAGAPHAHVGCRRSIQARTALHFAELRRSRARRRWGMRARTSRS